MEKYRSGHNGPDSKSGNPLTGTVGSNPTFSATRQGPGANSRSRLFPCPKGKPASCASVSTGCCARQGPGAMRAPGFFRIQKGNPRPAQAFQPVAARGKGLEPCALQAFSVFKRETRVLRKRFNHCCMRRRIPPAPLNQRRPCRSAGALDLPEDAAGLAASFSETVILAAVGLGGTLNGNGKWRGRVSAIRGQRSTLDK